MSNEKTLLTLSDTSILHIVKLLQVAIISGTDITDHFRRVSMIADNEGVLWLDPDYQDEFKETLEKMSQFIEEQTASQGE